MRPMLTAAEARIKSFNDVAVLQEIHSLEEVILEGCADGLYEVVVTISRVMARNSNTEVGFAQAAEYFDAWTGARDDRQKTLQMNKVIQYFSDLGYTIDRQTNPNTQTTFQWVVAW